MDVLKATQTYVDRLISEVPGMKVLLMDAHTVCPHFQLVRLYLYLPAV